MSNTTEFVCMECGTELDKKRPGQLERARCEKCIIKYLFTHDELPPIIWEGPIMTEEQEMEQFELEEKEELEEKASYCIGHFTIDIQNNSIEVGDMCEYPNCINTHWCLAWKIINE